MDHGFDYAAQRPTPRFHAQIKGKPGFWGCGNSREEAIGFLIAAHKEAFGLEVASLGKLPR